MLSVCVWTSICITLKIKKKLAKLSTVHVIDTTLTLMKEEHFYYSLIAITLIKDIL